MIRVPSSVFVATALGVVSALPLLLWALGPVNVQANACQEVTFRTEDRLELVASLYVPRKKNSLAPGALLIHDRGGSRADLDLLAQRMSKQGFAVLVPDLRGHGKSVKDGLDWKALDEKERNNMWSFTSRDVEAAAKYLSDRDGVHTANLSMLGLGAGTLLATRHAIRDESVRGLALIEPMLVEDDTPANLYPSMADFKSLGGLPTFIVISRESHSNAKSACEAVMRHEDCKEFIELLVAKSDSAEILSDKRVPLTVSKWMMDQAQPKRGSDR